MKNIILLLLNIVFIAGLVEAKLVKDSIYQIPKTRIAPVIDGQQDAIWKAIDWNMQRWYNVGDPPSASSAADSGIGLSGMSKAMWDANNLYILFYSVDNILIDIPSKPNWDQDAIEIYIDGDNNKTAVTGVFSIKEHDTFHKDRANKIASSTSLSGIQYHFIFSHWTKGIEVGHMYNLGVRAPFDTTGMEYKIADVADDQGMPGWMLEVKIPLATLGVDASSIGAAGLKVGWEIQQDESDDATAGRASMSKWWSNSNNSWANAGIWGTALLSSREVDTVLQMVKTSATIKIDGQMDAAYKNANPVTTNLFRVGDPPTAEIVDTDPLMGAFLTAFPLWDATNMYLFVDVVDGIVTDIPANANWNQDAIEVYFDADNNHATETALSGNQFQMTFSNWTKGNEVGHLYNLGARAPFDTTGMDYKIVDHDSRGNLPGFAEEGSGYNVEIKIPLASLGIDGSTAGQKIGFELQLDNSNDAAVGRAGMQKWWSASNHSWENAQIWGNAQLYTPPVDDETIFIVNKPSSTGICRYTLLQNYPNPFNPLTTISYKLPLNSQVTLKVYDLLGKEVAILVKQNQSTGYKSITFDASNLPSGVYFYRLDAFPLDIRQRGSFSEIKKLILLK